MSDIANRKNFIFSDALEALVYPNKSFGIYG
jgi:hypothetical protein